jgi:hypothetical protein
LSEQFQNQKSNIKFVERGNNDSTSTQIHARWLSLYVHAFQLQFLAIKLVLCSQTTNVQRTGNCLDTYDLTISVYHITLPKRLWLNIIITIVIKNYRVRLFFLLFNFLASFRTIIFIKCGDRILFKHILDIVPHWLIKGIEKMK